MVFTVEDGTGLAAANAYLSVADFTTHHTDRGRTINSMASVIQGAIVRATDYIDKRFGKQFVGYKSTSAQALEWPRHQAMDEDGWTFDDIPTQLKKATAEYAWVAINLGVLAPRPPHESTPENLDGTTGTVAQGEVTKEKMGPMETEYKPISDSRDPRTFGSLPEYPEADLWLQELTVGSNRLLERS